MIGTKIKKFFPLSATNPSPGWFQGLVDDVKYKRITGETYYHVLYEDGDDEWMTAEELCETFLKRRVAKLFGHRVFHGSVTHFTAADVARYGHDDVDLWQVTYDDGDQEEYPLEDLQKILIAADIEDEASSSDENSEADIGGPGHDDEVSHLDDFLEEVLAEGAAGKKGIAPLFSITNASTTSEQNGFNSWEWNSYGGCQEDDLLHDLEENLQLVPECGMNKSRSSYSVRLTNEWVAAKFAPSAATAIVSPSCRESSPSQDSSSVSSSSSLVSQLSSAKRRGGVDYNHDNYDDNYDDDKNNNNNIDSDGDDDNNSNNDDDDSDGDDNHNSNDDDNGSTLSRAEEVVLTQLHALESAFQMKKEGINKRKRSSNIENDDSFDCLPKWKQEERINWIQANTDPRTGQGRFVFRRSAGSLGKKKQPGVVSLLGGNAIDPWPVITKSVSKFVQTKEFFVISRDDWNPWGPRFPCQDGLLNALAFSQTQQKMGATNELFHLFQECHTNRDHPRYQGPSAAGAYFYAGVYRRIVIDETTSSCAGDDAGATEEKIPLHRSDLEATRWAIAEWAVRQKVVTFYDMWGRYHRVVDGIVNPKYTSMAHVTYKDEWDGWTDMKQKVATLVAMLIDLKCEMKTVAVKCVGYNAELYDRLVEINACKGQLSIDHNTLGPI